LLLLKNEIKNNFLLIRVLFFLIKINEIETNIIFVGDEQHPCVVGQGVHRVQRQQEGLQGRSGLLQESPQNKSELPGQCQTGSWTL